MTVAATPTIGARLAARGGFGPGFDWIRIVLAVSVAATHINSIVPRDAGHFALPPAYHFGILYAFFGLSGFLVTASAERLGLANFMLNRSLRIFPALMVDIALSAMLLGAIFTTLPLGAYYAHPMTHRYLLNMVGAVQLHLPGVFETSTVPAVNYSLWTVPFELACYALIGGLIVTRSFRLAPLLALGWVAAGFAVAALPALGPLDPALNHLFVLKGSRLLVAFLLGIAAYRWRNQIPRDPRLLAAAIAACIALDLLLAPSEDDVFYPTLSLLLGVPVLYVTLWLGTAELPTPALLKRGDYSYGIYLYHWPIMQALVLVLPNLGHAGLYFLVIMPVVAGFAALSWHLIEKPVLAQRRRFSFATRQRTMVPGE
ncbi:MAG: acyltransferase [Amaricoccus sp.]|uniref:acyltransferase family protein n=1 Tax=Amaricoccus sp. TaxID=1872485 RepID=UPI0039E6F2AD